MGASARARVGGVNTLPLVNYDWVDLRMAWWWAM